MIMQLTSHQRMIRSLHENHLAVPHFHFEPFHRAHADPLILVAMPHLDALLYITILEAPWLARPLEDHHEIARSAS